MVKMIIPQLEYLGVGKVSPLSSTDRTPAKEGIIVSTPYVETGANIQPPIKLLVDSGRTIIIDKGAFKTTGDRKNPYPWTTKDTDKQRTGRVSRLEPGIVFKPESAGTGDEGLLYPSPTLFENGAVSEFFGVPQLTPISGAICSKMPYYRLNLNKLSTVQSQKSVTMIHALSLAGVKQQDWERFYTRKRQGRQLGEDYEFVDAIGELNKWNNVPLLPWDVALYHLHTPNVTQYSINGVQKWLLPVTPINGSWQEIEQSQSHNLRIERVDEAALESKYESFKRTIDRFRSEIASKADSMGDTPFAAHIRAMA